MTVVAQTRPPIHFGRPWVTDEDRKAVARVLDSPVLTHGPECKAFETEFSAYVGGGTSVSLSSCTAALHVSYMHFGIKAGDDVLVPAQTHTATAHAVELVGARPVFVDCDPKTGNVTAEILEAAVTPKTKALTLVHFLGVPCDMPAIMEVAQRHKLKVIEDCAIALGSRIDGKHVGLFGDTGCFSFYPVKHITTGDGGMLTAKDPDVAAGVAGLRAFKVDRSYGERDIPGMYDVVGLGLNYRMSEMQGALGRSQLSRMAENLAIRKRNFTRLKALLQAIPGVTVLDTDDRRMTHSHYCLTFVLDGPSGKKRNDVVRRLNAAGVGTSIYYPQPVPRMTYYKQKYGYDAKRFPQAERISDRSIALPVGVHVSEDDVERMGAEVKAAVKAVA